MRDSRRNLPVRWSPPWLLLKIERRRQTPSPAASAARKYMRARGTDNSDSQNQRWSSSVRPTTLPTSAVSRTMCLRVGAANARWQKCRKNVPRRRNFREIYEAVRTGCLGPWLTTLFYRQQTYLPHLPLSPRCLRSEVDTRNLHGFPPSGRRPTLLPPVVSPPLCLRQFLRVALAI